MVRQGWRHSARAAASQGADGLAVAVPVRVPVRCVCHPRGRGAAAAGAGAREAPRRAPAIAPSTIHGTIGVCAHDPRSAFDILSTVHIKK